jgi:hypothetical protein
MNFQKNNYCNVWNYKLLIPPLISVNNNNTMTINTYYNILFILRLLNLNAINFIKNIIRCNNGFINIKILNDINYSIFNIYKIYNLFKILINLNSLKKNNLILIHSNIKLNNEYNKLKKIIIYFNNLFSLNIYKNYDKNILNILHILHKIYNYFNIKNEL